MGSGVRELCLVFNPIPTLYVCDFGLIYFSSLNLSLLIYEMRLKFNL